MRIFIVSPATVTMFVGDTAQMTAKEPPPPGLADPAVKGAAAIVVNSR